jgi:hypothetical protein
LGNTPGKTTSFCRFLGLFDLSLYAQFLSNFGREKKPHYHPI